MGRASRIHGIDEKCMKSLVGVVKKEKTTWGDLGAWECGSVMLRGWMWYSSVDGVWPAVGKVHFCEHTDGRWCMLFVNCKYKRFQNVRLASPVHYVVPLVDPWCGFWRTPLEHENKSVLWWGFFFSWLVVWLYVHVYNCPSVDWYCGPESAVLRQLHLLTACLQPGIPESGGGDSVCCSSIFRPSNDLCMCSYHIISLLLLEPSDSGSISVCQGWLWLPVLDIPIV